ncbi:DUF397 domain-containing protein [Actinomadura sp. CNU-125]|uniref:DUF397 domain-containing protein n=1 Tax=Actinomadura sp. CNU-125 TaxID=1904961 RepID=UPI000964CAAF|nr:DUF397 domain-containing protein [Actinomadura sp. CNU-125]OLT38185.1 DUF397 domain-containing protein [Actinomadura sp. CNU-125]
MDRSEPTWRKASRSTDTGGNCVELAGLPDGIGIRDSKNPTGPKLLIGRDAFRALVSDLRR